MAGLLAAGCLVAGPFGCERSGNGADDGANQKDETDGRPEAYQLKLPPYEKDGRTMAPGVTLSVALHDVSGSTVSKLRQPVGNAIYLSLRECPEAFPERGSEARVGVRFELAAQGVRAVEAEDVGPAGASDAPKVARDDLTCFLDKLADRAVEWPDGLEVDEPIRVSASSTLKW